MSECDYCQHVEMCGWRKSLEESGCDFFDDANRWIPVSERLPEENGFYLTTTMYHEVYCDYWEEDNFNRTEAVIAWMPLPEPYKAESEKEDLDNLDSMLKDLWNDTESEVEE